MLDHVVQRLLRDAVETKRRGVRHRSRHGAISKLDRHLVRHGEFLAKSLHRRHKTELLQFGRMQFMRKPVNFGRQSLHLRGEFLHPFANLSALPGGLWPNISSSTERSARLWLKSSCNSRASRVCSFSRAWISRPLRSCAASSASFRAVLSRDAPRMKTGLPAASNSMRPREAIQRPGHPAG